MGMFRNLMMRRRRNVIPGFVGGWKAYGRSNSEDPATREILPDYSGNGRDIRLYNFDFTENSGYSGGGLVSDGVDDYGQCIKGFALPDDYTVVAIRKYIGEWKNTDGALLVAKRGAFDFEGQTATIYCSSYRHGVYFSYSILPALFSYQNKTSYNGQAITPGDSIDDSSVPLIIFGKVNYVQAVLYDLRIYDHSLTDEELQLVKDDMMRNYEKNAKPLEGITYVADWDAKGRSNDEDADVRDKWIDKTTGKVINLNNFAYAGMSGWNGYKYDFSNWRVPNFNPITNFIQGNTLTVRSVMYNKINASMIANFPIENFRIRVKGLTAGIAAGEIDYIKVYFDYSGGKIELTEDGDYNINLLPNKDSGYFQIYVVNLDADDWTNLTTPVTVEQLPLYPGALVGDGIMV